MPVTITESDYACTYKTTTCARRSKYYPTLELLEVQSNSKLLSEYSQDIINYSAVIEASNSINVLMIDLQPEIQWFMRPFLLDFLIELHTSFRLQPQTLFLCLNIVDRYCSKRIVFKRHYQLVGCTALWIAGKYEDKKSRVPTLKELSMMCRDAYDDDMFVQMEMHILATLDWSLSHTNLEECLQIAISASEICPQLTPRKYNAYPQGASSLSAVTAVGRFLCELSLYQKFFLTVPSSLVSITANLLACSMLQIPNASIYVQKLLSNKKEEVNNRMFDENSENKQPDVEGPFLSGFDSKTIQLIRKLCIMFVLQLSQVTEVLSKKYEELGVIEVVNNFTSRFSHIIDQIQKMAKGIEGSPIELFDSGSVAYLADSLLYLSNMHVMAKFEEYPLTPPSASSQFSIFSGHKSEYFSEKPLMSANNLTVNFEKVDEITSDSSFMNEEWVSPIPSKTIV